MEQFKSKNGAITPSNDEQMINEGLRQPYVDVDKDVFVKTSAEKSILKDLRNTTANPAKGNVYGKEVLYTFLVHYNNPTRHNKFPTTGRLTMTIGDMNSYARESHNISMITEQGKVTIKTTIKSFKQI